jgi:hypothetical protein
MYYLFAPALSLILAPTSNSIFFYLNEIIVSADQVKGSWYLVLLPVLNSFLPPPVSLIFQRAFSCGTCWSIAAANAIFLVIMTSASFHPGDMVQVVGGKYKGHSAVVVVLKTKMVDIKLLPSHTQVRVMIHNVSSFPPGERQNICKVIPCKDHISLMSLEQRNQCVLELLKIRDSIDSLVSLFSDFKF